MFYELKCSSFEFFGTTTIFGFLMFPVGKKRYLKLKGAPRGFLRLLDWEEFVEIFLSMFS